MVARSRGIRFVRNETRIKGEIEPDPNTDDFDKASAILEEVAEWLGYAGSMTYNQECNPEGSAKQILAIKRKQFRTYDQRRRKQRRTR